MSYKKTDKLIKYNNDFNKNNYDRISLMLPKGKKDLIKSIASNNGESVNAFINRAIDTEINKSMGGGFQNNEGENSTEE